MTQALISLGREEMQSMIDEQGEAEVHDKLIEGAYKEPDDAKRMQMLHDAEKVLVNDAPIAPLYFYNTSLLSSDKVSGIVSSSLSYTDLRKAVVK